MWLQSQLDTAPPPLMCSVSANFFSLRCFLRNSSAAFCSTRRTSTHGATSVGLSLDRKPFLFRFRHLFLPCPGPSLASPNVGRDTSRPPSAVGVVAQTSSALSRVRRCEFGSEKDHLSGDKLSDPTPPSFSDDASDNKRQRLACQTKCFPNAGETSYGRSHGRSGRRINCMALDIRGILN